MMRMTTNLELPLMFLKVEAFATSVEIEETDDVVIVHTAMDDWSCAVW